MRSTRRHTGLGKEALRGMKTSGLHTTRVHVQRKIFYQVCIILEPIPTILSVADGTSPMAMPCTEYLNCDRRRDSIANWDRLQSMGSRPNSEYQVACAAWFGIHKYLLSSISRHFWAIGFLRGSGRILERAGWWIQRVGNICQYDHDYIYIRLDSDLNWKHMCGYYKLEKFFLPKKPKVQ